jgi:3,4-dihydroxy 2-butanone 4-phosphate synthase/GTP cyclohydrolase II
VGSQILASLGVSKMRLLSSPKRYHSLSGFGLEVTDYISE